MWSGRGHPVRGRVGGGESPHHRHPWYLLALILLARAVHAQHISILKKGGKKFQNQIIYIFIY